jgi:hypothetical protein
MSCHRQADTKWNEISRNQILKEKSHPFIPDLEHTYSAQCISIDENLTNATAPILQHGGDNSYHRAIMAQQ